MLAMADSPQSLCFAPSLWWSYDRVVTLSEPRMEIDNLECCTLCWLLHCRPMGLSSLQLSSALRSSGYRSSPLGEASRSSKEGDPIAWSARAHQQAKTPSQRLITTFVEPVPCEQPYPYVMSDPSWPIFPLGLWTPKRDIEAVNSLWSGRWKSLPECSEIICAFSSDSSRPLV